jgi:DNA-binding NarL/FixJ family response regulator
LYALRQANRKLDEDLHFAEKRDEMGRAVGFMDDLFFQMKVAETAKHVGVEFKVASTSAALMGLLDAPTKLVIVDLNAKNQPLVALQQLRGTQKDLRVVAFLSHVQTELAAQARTAGCSEVMPRSAFTQNLAAILQLAKD